jgi:hypothetical protein
VFRKKIPTFISPSHDFSGMPNLFITLTSCALISITFFCSREHSVLFKMDVCSKES